MTTPEQTFPSGIIVGTDDTVIAGVQEAMASLGSTIERVGTADAARERILSEHPELCFYVGGQVTAPPYGPMTPLMGLPAATRRRLYLVLVADNLKTLDGAAAFLFQVNMVLQARDVPQLATPLHEGIDYHARLYRSFFETVE